MRNSTRFFAAVVAVGFAAGLGLAGGAVAQAPADPDPVVHVASSDPLRATAEVEAEIDAFWAEVDKTGMLPIGVNDAGDGPYGFVAVDDAVVTAGSAHADLKVYDASGAHVGWVVYGLEPMSTAAYEADPVAHRAAGLARVAALAGDATG